FSSRRRHTRFSRDWSSDVCSSDLGGRPLLTSCSSFFFFATAAAFLPVLLAFLTPFLSGFDPLLLLFFVRRKDFFDAFFVILGLDFVHGGDVDLLIQGWLDRLYEGILKDLKYRVPDICVGIVDIPLQWNLRG